jgi:hypothetical protein
MFIYGLFDPAEPDVVRYVGYTTKDAERRLREHVCEARKLKCHRHKWIAKLAVEGRRPGLVVLETLSEGDDWHERERFWIASFDGLVNGTAGGEGLIDPSLEVRGRISAKVSAGLKGNQRRLGVPHSVETKAKIAAGVRASAAYRLGMTARRGLPGRSPTPEARAKLSRAKKGKPRPWTPEWKARVRAAAKRNAAALNAKRWGTEIEA